jgi:hypothetical protein
MTRWDTVGHVKLVDSGDHEATLSSEGELKVCQEYLVAWDRISGTTVDTRVWTQSVSTMTVTQGSGFINMNAAASTTANAYAILSTNRHFPFYGFQSTKIDTSIKISALPDVNEVMELGFITCATNVAPTDGAFIRITNGTAIAVINRGGVETTASLGVPPVGVVIDTDITMNKYYVEFELGEANLVRIDVPSTDPFPTLRARQQLVYRVYNTATSPAAGCTLSVGIMEVLQEDVTNTRPWNETLLDMGRNACQLPMPLWTTTSNIVNSTVPATITLANSVAPNGPTVLCGQFKFNAVAAAETDYILFAFQVPGGFIMRVNEIYVSAYISAGNLAALTVFEWSVGIESTAVDLATVDGTGTVATRRKPLGSQVFLPSGNTSTQAIDLVRTYDPPLVINSGRYFHVILRQPFGAATAGVIYRGTVNVNGFFE